MQPSQGFSGIRLPRCVGLALDMPVPVDNGLLRSLVLFRVTVENMLLLPDSHRLQVTFAFFMDAFSPQPDSDTSKMRHTKIVKREGVRREA